MKQSSTPASEVIRECANDLKPLKPGQRVYCSSTCKQIVRLWRLKMALAVKR